MKHIISIVLLTLSSNVFAIDKAEITPHDSAQVAESGQSSHRFLVKGQSFSGITVGDKLSQHADKLKKGIVQMPDGGVYEALYIHEGQIRIGYVMPGGRNWDSVNSITITESRAVTEQGIQLGTTWETLKNTIPSLELHRFGFEGQIFAFSGNTGYQLSIDPNTYTAESSIRKDHIVTGIWLGTRR